MKSLFFIVLGAIPLAFLTVIAFGAVLFTPTWKPEITVEQFDEITVALDKVKRELEPLSNAPEALAKENLIGCPTPQSLRSLPTEGSIWGNTSELANLWGNLFGCAQNFLKSQRQLQSDNVSDMLQIQDDIASFQKCLDEQHSSAKKVIGHLNDLQKEVAVKTERLQKKEEATQILIQARNAFDAKRWIKCARLCKQLQDEYSDYIATDVKADVSIMSNRCEVFLSNGGDSATSESEPVNTPQAAPENVAESDPANVPKAEPEKLTQRVDSPKTLNNSGKKQELSQKQRGKSRPKKTTTVAGPDETVRVKIQSFYDAPSLSAKVKAADKILATDNSVEARNALKNEFLECVYQEIPEMTCPNAKFAYQGTLKDGTVLKGKFVRVRDGKIIGYRFFENESQLNDPARKKLLYKAEDFTSKPAPTLSYELVAQYNGARKNLMQNVNDLKAWTSFVARCTELEIRRKAEGITDISFEQPLKAAKMVIEPELGVPFKNIMGEK